MTQVNQTKLNHYKHGPSQCLTKVGENKDKTRAIYHISAILYFYNKSISGPFYFEFITCRPLEAAASRLHQCGWTENALLR